MKSVVMPLKEVPKVKPLTPRMCCAVCSNEVEKGEVATCVECKRSAHRCLAGVPLDEFERADGSYTCLSCLKKLHESEMADMSDCIMALKAEIVELREALKEAINDAPKIVEVNDSKQVALRNSSVTWSTVVSRSRKNKEKNESTLSKCPPRNSDSDSPVTVAKVQRPKSEVKCKQMVITRSKTHQCLQLYLASQPLECVKNYKYHGVVIFSSLSWSEQIQSICDKSRKLMGMLYCQFYLSADSYTLLQFYCHASDHILNMHTQCGTITCHDNMDCESMLGI